MANIKWSAFTDGGEMQVNDQTVGLRAGDNYRFNFPGTGIKDSSGNYLVGWLSVGAAAVNYLQISNSATGNAPFIAPNGTDANITLLLKSKGNGDITLTPSGTGVINASTTLLLSTSTPTLALQAASKGYVDSVIPSYPITLALGGTSAALVASNGGIFYSTATAGAILAGTSTANQVLLSGSSSAPSWSTATYPATTTINQLLYSGAANVISGLTTANNGLLVTSNTGVPSILATSGVTGNMLRSNAAAAPSWSTAIFADTYAVNTILYASSSNSVSGLATANNGVLITSAGGVPSIGSTLPSAVQSNITQVGTISSGTWNGSIIGSMYGGTGVNNGGSTLTLGGNLITSGAFASTFTMTGATNVTFPTSGTLATTSQIPAFPLSLANGGTNANLTAANGGIVYSNASALAILAPTSTATQVLMSGSNTTPAWSTATFASTYAASTLLYSNGANTVTGLATANSAVLTTSSTGIPAWSSTMTNGQIIIGSTGATPTAATLTAGSGINITNAAGSITITSTGGGLIVATISGTTQSAAVNTKYYALNSAQTTLTLPTTFAVGDVVALIGSTANTSGWIVNANTGKTIRVNNTTTSAGGTVTSAATAGQTIYLECDVANTSWVMSSTTSVTLTTA